MTMERYIRAIAGTFILASLLLAYYASPYWLWFTAFVGANLLQSAFTRWCLMEDILAKLGVAQKASPPGEPLSGTTG
jgi:Inner membrane protein YgaP-like, transmembrane domain